MGGAVVSLPDIALSVRQPWAWAIVHAGKRVENRSRAAVRHMGGYRGPLAIHAAKGMTRDEYESASAFMAGIGVVCPPPADLVRGAIIGTVVLDEVMIKVREADMAADPWLFGPCALVLTRPRAVEPIPAAGALGLFRWQPGGALCPPAKWMRREPAASVAVSSTAPDLFDGV